MAFEGAWLKVERANKHIADLRAAFDAFVKIHPHRVTVGADATTGEMTFEVHFKDPMPSDFALILGDAIHNLRCALDHATWELIGLDGGTQDRWTKFPTGDSQISYEASCNGMKTPRADTRQFFTRFGAYNRGPGEWLYALHLLDNAEKHTVLTPIVGVASIRNMQIFSAEGVLMATLQDNKVGMGPDGRARLMRLAPGLTAQFDKTTPAIDIFFGDIESFRFQPIFPTLQYLSGTVTDTMNYFADFLATRGEIVSRP